MALLLGDVVDFTAERARLGKEIGKLGGEAGKIEAKLANADFLSRAPDGIVEEQRERLEDLQGRRSKLELALGRLANV